LMAAALADIPVGTSPNGTPLRMGEVRDAAALRFGARCLRQVDPAVFEPIVAGRWLDQYDPEEVAQRIKCPTLLLEADYNAGGMLTEEDGARFAARVERCCRVRMPGVPHLIHWMETEATLRVVCSF